MSIMSDLDGHKKKFVEILASRHNAVATKDDIYDFMAGSISKDTFNQVIESLIDEGSIERVEIGSFRLTVQGERTYSLEHVTPGPDSSRYVSQDKDEGLVIVTQDTQYTSTTTGLYLTDEEKAARNDKVRKQVLACFIFIIIVATLITLAISFG